MKKGQSTIEYLLCIILAIVLCYAVSTLWNRTIVIQNAADGAEDAGQVIHVRPMGN